MDRVRTLNSARRHARTLAVPYATTATAICRYGHSADILSLACVAGNSCAREDAASAHALGGVEARLSHQCNSGQTALRRHFGTLLQRRHCGAGRTSRASTSPPHHSRLHGFTSFSCYCALSLNTLAYPHRVGTPMEAFSPHLQYLSCSCAIPCLFFFLCIYHSLFCHYTPALYIHIC